MSLSKDLNFLILQYLDDEKLKGTRHMLERETALFFDINYFEELLLNGNWDESERYLSGFTKFGDNRFSTKIYFEIRKQKYLEALDRHDSSKALEILKKELKVFSVGYEGLFKDLTLLLTLDDFRQHESLVMYEDTNIARQSLSIDVKKLIAANPLLYDKLEFPKIRNQSLCCFNNQSLTWQHLHCTNPQEDPEITIPFVDHVCPNLQPSDNNLPPSQDMPAPFSTSPAAWISSPLAVTHAPISRGASSLGSLRSPDVKLEDPKDSANESKTISVIVLDEEISATTYPDKSHSSAADILNDLPKTVARTLNEGSAPRTMDFHPIQHTVLLVGTSVGDIGLWEFVSGKKLLSRNFKVWDIAACSMIFKVALMKNSVISVNRMKWSPDGSIFGVAYSKHIVQLYSYNGGSDVRQQLEIDAHVGGVNDLAFSRPDKLLLVITCGDDKSVKAWDVISGSKMYTFEGHEAPVHSVCPHIKENIHFIFSTSIDGKIKAWLYDNFGARVNYDAPGRCCTRMTYSTNNMRLFSCGTIKDGKSFMVEWNECEGSTKRTYQGLSKRSSSVLEFDTTNNQLLAVGDEYMIKFWDMNNVELLTTIDADRCLPASPIIRFNVDGTLLAVVANENSVKILATNAGLRLLGKSEYHSTDNSVPLSETMRKLDITQVSTLPGTRVVSRGLSLGGSTTKMEELESKTIGASNGKSKVGGIVEINKPSQCHSIKLPSPDATTKVSRLMYSNKGYAILALVSNVTNLLWKWPENESNLSSKATTKVVPPILWQPSVTHSPLTNDLSGANLEEVVPCFALSKNDSYLISSSGGSISLFNLLSKKRMTHFTPSTSVVTCLALHPQDNNIIAIGMEDSSIMMFNIRSDEILSVQKGHSKRITGLAFSDVLNVLVSSGSDAQIVVWYCDSDEWEKQQSASLNIPVRKQPGRLVHTHIQFHRDQIHLLAVHDTLLAIYETTKLECENQWISDCVPISHATFSCDGQLVMASFLDGSVYIFGASDLQLQYCITPSAYYPFEIRSDVYPVVIAAHPKKTFQFALGLSDGGVYVLEPREISEKWPQIED